MRRSSVLDDNDHLALPTTYYALKPCGGGAADTDAAATAAATVEGAVFGCVGIVAIVVLMHMQHH